MYSPETLAEINLLREKARAGTMTLEDTKRGIELLREGRAMMAPVASKSKSTPVSADSLFSELDNL